MIRPRTISNSLRIIQTIIATYDNISELLGLFCKIYNIELSLLKEEAQWSISILYKNSLLFELFKELVVNDSVTHFYASL